MWVNGVAGDADATYRVTMNNFLATGGDGFTVFNQGTEPLGGAAGPRRAVAYFGAQEPAGYRGSAVDSYRPDSVGRIDSRGRAGAVAGLPVLVAT